MEGTDTLTLKVNGDPRRIVAGLTEAQKMLSAINDDSAPEDVVKAGKFFGSVIFGEEQTEKLFEFYHGDAGCVINICGQYFSEQLKKLIIKAQKRAK
jgi:hypothetical protein